MASLALAEAEALEAVKKDWKALKDLSEQQKNNPTIVKLAVAQNGHALKRLRRAEGRP